MLLQEIGLFFSAFPVLERSMRNLADLAGYWNYAHRERDAAFGLASAMFGVMIVDVETLQRALATFLDDWAEWVNSPTRLRELSDSVEWYSGSISLRDSMLTTLGDRVKYFAGANTLSRMVTSGGIEDRSYDYFDVVRGYFSALGMRFRMPSSVTFSPYDFMVMPDVALDWRDKLTAKSTLTYFIPSNDSIYIVTGLGTNDTSKQINFTSGLLKYVRAVDATLDYVSVLDGVHIAKCKTPCHSDTAGNKNVQVRFGDSSTNYDVGTGQRYSFKLGDNVRLIFGDGSKMTEDTNGVLRIRGRFQMSSCGIETMMTFRNYSKTAYSGGFTGQLGRMMSVHSVGCSSEIIESINTAVQTIMKRAFKGVYPEMTLTFPQNFYDFNIFTKIVMKLAESNGLTESGKTFILIVYVRLCLLFMTPFLLTGMRN